MRMVYLVLVVLFVSSTWAADVVLYPVGQSSVSVTNEAWVQKTGQTVVYQDGDDGYYQRGVMLPIPRFTVQDNTNCVMDNLTGLVWARNADLGGLRTWSAAVTYCEGLVYGGTNDWRMPNIQEMLSLNEDSTYQPSLPEGHPFFNVQASSGWWYWTSTTYAGSTASAWAFTFSDGHEYFFTKAGNSYSVWPVRGGQ